MTFASPTVELPEVALSPRYSPVWAELLAWLDAGGDERAKFDMGRFFDEKADCGTTCCIAGKAMMIAHGCNSIDDFRRAGGIWNAGVVLGMEPNEARTLFGFGNHDVVTITDSHRAATVCRHWIATGAVDWTIGAPT